MLQAVLLKLCPSLTWKASYVWNFFPIRAFFPFILISDRLLWALSKLPKFVFYLPFQFSGIFILHFIAWIIVFNWEMVFHLFGGHSDEVLMMSIAYLILEPLNRLIYMAKGAFQVWWSSGFCDGEIILGYLGR